MATFRQVTPTRPMLRAFAAASRARAPCFSERRGLGQGGDLLGRPGEVALALATSGRAAAKGNGARTTFTKRHDYASWLSTLLAIPQRITARYAGRPGLPRPRSPLAGLLLPRTSAVARLACTLLRRLAPPLHLTTALAVLARASAPPRSQINPDNAAAAAADPRSGDQRNPTRFLQ